MKCLNLRTLFGALAMGAALSTVHTASAAFVNLGPAGDYNIFLFGDNTQFNSDVEGALAVGGNVDFTTAGGGFTVASKASPGATNLVVGGNFKNQWHSLKGSLLVNGDVNWQGPTIGGSVSINGNANFGNSGGEIGSPVNVVGAYAAPDYFPVPGKSSTPLPFSFEDVRDYLELQSSSLAALTPNGTTKIEFQQVRLTATGPSSGLYVFDVLGSDLAAAAGHGLSITAPAGSTVVVNVDGSAASFQNMGISLTGVDRQHVLYNFHQADSLLLNAIGVQGTILAPKASVNFINGSIDGSLIANHLTGGGESHLHLFQGTLPNPVPEPSTLALAGLGAALVGLQAYRRRCAD